MITFRGPHAWGEAAYAGGGTPAAAAGPKRVLIVEDHPLSMKLFSDLLEAHGHRTVRATTGRSALDAARAARPDLVLVDMELPDLSGLDVVRRLRADAQTGGIAIIAMSASAVPGIRRRAIEAGCDGFIEKPIDLDQFLRTVAAQLYRRAP